MTTRPPMADFPVLLNLGHNPNHIFRGHKADIFDGGHYVLFIARCPGPGGWNDPKPGSKVEVGLPAVQLYDFAPDIGEKTNLQATRSD